MQRKRSAFGKAFEERGDLGKAIEAYRSAGLEDDVRRVASRVTTLETAARLEEMGFHARAVDLLLDGGFQKDAEAFCRRVEKAGTMETNYVRTRVLAEKKDIADMEETFKDRVKFGAHGRYMFGMAVSKAFPDVTRRIADELSGKPIEPLEGAREREGDGRLFIGFTSAKQMSDAMLSMLFNSMDNKHEMAYFAMILYRRIGDEKEAERCLPLMGEGEDGYLFYAALTKGGFEEVRRRGISLDNGKRLVLALAQGRAEAVTGVIERWHGSAEEEKLENASELLHECSKYAPELLTVETIAALVAYIGGKKENIGKEERAKLDRFEELLSYGGLDSIREAIEVLKSVKLRYAGVAYWDLAKRCADAAFGIGTVESLAFAGDIYGRTDLEKQVECADLLVRIGGKKEARALFDSVAGWVAYKLRTGPEDAAPDPRMHSLRETIIQKAFALEKTHPALSLSVYKHLDDEGVKRTARAILATGTFEEMVEAAWAVSTVEKDGLLMRDALTTLEGFGEEGMRKASGIRGEMRVPKVFVVR